MPTFILVHGAYHGVWCWVKVLPELEARGHRAIALDMPGCGDDRTPLSQVTFDDYASRIGEALPASSEPVVLVGHSLGALSISLAAERYPERIKRLVYVSGCIPVDGMSLYGLLQVLTDQKPPLRTEPPAGHPWCGLSQMPPLDEVAELYYNDCSQEDIAYAKARLRAQLNAVRVTPLRLSPGRFGKIPRSYIGCTLDNANSLALQRAIVSLCRCETVSMLETGHSPFFSKPGMLADALAALA
jgi:pimeloyl-ACP methyl ester carboxylesterase